MWSFKLVGASFILAAANIAVVGAHIPLRVGLVTGGNAELFKEAATSKPECPPVTTQADFSLDDFVAKPWYIQQQAETTYLPKSQNYCVTAEYHKMAKANFWGYTIQVHNHAEEKDGKVHDSGKTLCAAEDSSPDPAKLEVAPCFLPKLTSGPYWVLEFNNTAGYALISGGQPTHKYPGGCRSGSGINDSGLWIFTRAQERDEAVVQKVRALAQKQGFDLTQLNDVDQTNCSHNPALVQ